jgi:hypothetical protein
LLAREREREREFSPQPKKRKDLLIGNNIHKLKRKHP